MPAQETVEPASLLSEERRPDRIRARGKTKELLVNDRAANLDRASLHRSARTSPEGGKGIGGGRSSAESVPHNQAAHLPEGRRASRLVRLASTSEETEAGARREPRIRGGDTAGPAPPPPEVLRPPKAGCRLLMTPTDTPVGTARVDSTTEAAKSAQGAYVAAEAAWSAHRVGTATEVARPARRVSVATEMALLAQPDGTHDQETSGIFSSIN